MWHVAYTKASFSFYLQAMGVEKQQLVSTQRWNYLPATELAMQGIIQSASMPDNNNNSSYVMNYRQAWELY